MLQFLHRCFREAPVTAGCMFLCGALYAATLALQVTADVPFRTAQAKLGAVSSSGYAPTDGSEDPERTGPMQLWDGQLWRIPLSVLHHGGILHLAMNCMAMWYLGRLLESNLGHWRLIVLLSVSGVVSFVPEYLLGNVAVGISGALFALFGYLIVLRKTDQSIAEQFTDDVVKMGLGWAVICLPLTYLDILPIANLAHFSGLGYGWLAGQVACGRLRDKRLSRPLFAVAHLLLIPAIYFVQNPTWDALYHLHRAMTLSEKDGPKYVDQLRRATQIDPQLEITWVLLAEAKLHQNKGFEAWRTVLQGISENPSSDKLIRHARRIAPGFHTIALRNRAREILHEELPTNSDVWEQQLLAQLPERLETLPETAPDSETVPEADTPPEQSVKAKFEQWRRSLTDPYGELPGPPGPILLPDPNSPGSALFGEST